MASTSRLSKPKKKAHFSEPDNTSDIVFIVEGQKIHFTKAFLSVCSPVFERMFESDFTEKNATRIPLPDKRYGEMVEFFKQIHPVFAPIATVKDGNLLALLELSREYGMDSVHKKCQLYIRKEAKIEDQSHDDRQSDLYRYSFDLYGKGRIKGLTAERVMLFLYACQTHELDEYSDALKERAAEFNTKDIEKSEYYSLLDQDTLFDIYRARSKLME